MQRGRYVVMAVSLLLLGCGGGGGSGDIAGEGATAASKAVNPLVGSWMDEPHGLVRIDTYNDDGTLEARVFQSANGTQTLIKQLTATYSVDGDTVTVVFEGVTSTATFAITGDTLTITVTSDPGSGEVFTYTRYTGDPANPTKALRPEEDSAASEGEAPFGEGACSWWCR